MKTVLQCGPYTLDLAGLPLIMGILNATPDSFSDGGRYQTVENALQHAEKMVADGAGIIDIGGESTRPFAPKVSQQEEIDRVVPVVEAVAKLGVPISIDTTKSGVARAAIAAGAVMINDISAMTGDPEMISVAARAKVPVVLMHMQGTPQTMQNHPVYADPVDDVIAFLRSAIRQSVNGGVSRDSILVDPGFGFGKTVAHNLTMLSRLEEFHALECPILVGTSRKSFIQKTIGNTLGENPEAVNIGTQATHSAAVFQGAHILRVHDVAACATTVRMAHALKKKSLP